MGDQGQGPTMRTGERQATSPGVGGAYRQKADSRHSGYPAQATQQAGPATGQGSMAPPLRTPPPAQAPPMKPKGQVAEDEPTLIGGSDDHPRASMPSIARRDEPDQRAGFVTVVASHKDPPEQGPGLPFVQDADSPVAASFRVLRQRMREVGRPHTIVVTSPNRREGKTTCAINLAMSFAEHSRGNILLVEANLRSPGLAASLGFTTPSCFARQMAAHRANPLAPWEMVAAFFPNLHVLAVDAAANGQWLINGPTFKTAMEQLRGSGYEQIVVDCPPTLGTADVNVIEDSADGVLLAAIAGRTTADSLERAARQLAPANILGIVMMQPY